MVMIEGTTSSDSLYGKSSNDSISGGSGDDSLYGYTGNDTLFGGSGNDFINGAGSAYADTTGPQSFGTREIDTLTGNSGSDTFQLWGGSARGGMKVYYNSQSTADYALITDFNSSEDIIQLTSVTGSGSSPSVVSYILGASPDGLPTGTGLYVDKPDTQSDELIAILQGVTPDSISLNGNYFSYFG